MSDLARALAINAVPDSDRCQPIPLAVPNLGRRESEYVQECIAGNWVSTTGPFVDRLEREIAALSGVPFGVAVAAGTMGLHAVLHALDIGRGDLVVLPTYTFIASANAIAHTGARPWLFDVTPESWTIDPADLARAFEEDCARDRKGDLRLKETGERVAAIMPVYTLGTPADMDAIVPLARSYALPVIADAAAAIGARYRGRPIGALANASVYSFNGNKTITTGGGGAIVGNDSSLMALLKHITTTARLGADYDHDRIGFNYRMTNIEAALGCAQLERLDAFLAAKRRIRRTYSEAFAAHPRVSVFPEVDWAESACWFSGVVLRDAGAGPLDRLVANLADEGIQGRKFWKPMHLQRPFADAPRRATPVADDLWTRVLTLPCSTSLTVAQQERVVSAMSRLLAQ